MVPTTDLRPNDIEAETGTPLAEYYQREAKRFNHYEIPVISEDYRVLTHSQAWRTALHHGVEELPVVMACGLTEAHLLRFICLFLIFWKLSYAARYRLILLLETHLQKTLEGQAWAEELKALGHRDINEQVAFLVDCHKETIKHLKRIGRHGVTFFQEGKTLAHMLLDVEEHLAQKALSGEAKKPRAVTPLPPIESFDGRGLQLQLDAATLEISREANKMTLPLEGIKREKNKITYTARSKDEKCTVQISLRGPFHLLNLLGKVKNNPAKN